MHPSALPDRLVLFDGTCLLCAACVRFVVPPDHRARIRFAPLHGPTGQRILQERGLPTDGPGTLVYLRHARTLTRSTAVLHLLRDLDGAWPLLAALLAAPRPLRDALYTAVARRRHRWWGRSAVCMVPGPALAGRFVQEPPPQA